MSTFPASPQDFARLLQDRLIEAGESRPLEFRADLFGFLPRGAGVEKLFPLDNYYRHYLEAAGEGDRQYVLRQFVRDWQTHWKSAAYLPSPAAAGGGGALPAQPTMPVGGFRPVPRPQASGGRIVLLVLGLMGLLFGLMCVAPCIVGAVLQQGAKRHFRNLPGRQWNFHQPPATEVTEMLGGPGGGPRFYSHPDQAPVVGLAYTIDQWGGETALGSLQPLYAPGDQPERNFGRDVKIVWARPGYALGGLSVDANNFVNGVKAKWVKLENGQPNWNDTYESEWLGQGTGRPTRDLGNARSAVVGLAVREGLVLDSVGLLTRQEAAPP